MQKLEGLTKISVWLLCCICVVSAFTADEGNLRTALSTGYSSAVRPEQTTEVYLNIVLLSLNALDIGAERMSISTMIKTTWTDSRLTWTPATYGGITDLPMSPADIWTPSVVVENAVENVGIIGGDPGEPVNAIVTQTGDVAWFNTLEMTTSCSVKIGKYPYDTQDCFVRLTGAGASESHVNISYSGSPIYLTYYTENGEWELQKTWAAKGQYDAGGTITFGRIDYYMRFRRKWQFYGLNLIMPIILTSVLMCAVFALPIESGEKMGFSLTVLLSYVVFLTWVTDNLPAVSSDTSVLQVYLALVLCLGVTVVLLTTWILHIYHTDNKVPMSKWMRFFVYKVVSPCLRCLCREGTRNSQLPTKNDSPLPNGNVDKLKLKMPNRVTPTDQVKEISLSENEAADDDVEYTWQEVATMIDRAFLFLSFVIKCMISFVILLLIYGGFEIS